jgi:DNA modification methylase
MSQTDTAVPLDETAVLESLSRNTYQEVADQFCISRGAVYGIAVKAGARKHEQRILERKAEREGRQREFLTSVMNATAKADVLDFLAGVPDQSVALHVFSPPYNIGRSYSATHDAFAFSFYLGWLLQVLSESARTLMPGGVLFMQVGATHGPDGVLYPIDIACFEHLRQMGLTFQSRIAWVTPHGLTPKRRLSERYETALVFSKGPAPRVFNPDPVRVPQKQPAKRSFKGKRKGELSGHPFGAFPSNVWHISNVRHNVPEKVAHPAQMPIELARRAILLYSNCDDLVMDCFAGSGTTAAACIETGRAFSGCDLSYEDLRRERLSKVAPDLVCLLPGVTKQSLAVWQAEARPVHVPAAQGALDLLGAAA